MYVFNYKPLDPEALTYYKVEEGEDYTRYIIHNEEYDFILVDELPEFSLTGEYYPVVDKILSTNEQGHRTGTLKLVKHIITEEQQKELIRYDREHRCFPIINRGQLWYDNLTAEQIKELDEWYVAWLNATETMIEPADLEWIK